MWPFSSRPGLALVALLVATRLHSTEEGNIIHDCCCKCKEDMTTFEATCAKELEYLTDDTPCERKVRVLYCVVHKACTLCPDAVTKSYAKKMSEETKNKLLADESCGKRLPLGEVALIGRRPCRGSNNVSWRPRAGNKSHTESGDSSRSGIYTGVGIAVVVLLLIIIATWCFCCTPSKSNAGQAADRSTKKSKRNSKKSKKSTKGGVKSSHKSKK